MIGLLGREKGCHWNEHIFLVESGGGTINENRVNEKQCSELNFARDTDLVAVFVPMFGFSSTTVPHPQAKKSVIFLYEPAPKGCFIWLHISLLWPRA